MAIYNSVVASKKRKTNQGDKTIGFPGCHHVLLTKKVQKCNLPIRQVKDGTFAMHPSHPGFLQQQKNTEIMKGK